MRFPKLNALKYHAALLLVVIILYIPLWSGMVYFNYDMVDCWLPWRTFISENLQHGTLPLWNPYQACGYPIYADLQGPLWSPESFISSILFSSTADALIFLFIGYITIAAWGMFDLLRYLKSPPRYAFIGAVLFAACGFFSAHCQHFYAIISAAWFPYLLLYTLKFLYTRTFKSGIPLILVLFMCTTTGNPSFTIITAYLILLLATQQLYILYREKNFVAIKSWLKHSSLLVVAALLLHAVLIVAFLQAFPYITRNAGLDLVKAGKEPFTWQCFLSYIAPLTTGAKSTFYNTADPMRNHFIGLYTLPLLVLVLRRKMLTGQDKILLGFAIFCLLASLGNQTPFFGWVHNLLPGANMFRFPAYYHFFTGTILLLLFAKHAAQLWEQTSQHIYQKLLWFTGGAFLIYIVLYLVIDPSTEYLPFNFRNLLLIQATLAVIYGSILGISFRRKAAIMPVLTILILSDSLLMGWANIYQFYDTGASRRAIKQDIIQASSYRLQNDTILLNKDQNPLVKTQWRNSNGYLHRVSADYFNSFELKHFVDFTSQQPESTATMLNHRLLYFKAPQPGDSIGNITISANGFQAPVHLSKPADVVALQTHFPYWKVYAGDRELTISSEACFMKTTLPPGNYILQFEFDPPYIYLATGITYVTFLILLAIAIQNRIKTLQKTK